MPKALKPRPATCLAIQNKVSPSGYGSNPLKACINPTIYMWAKARVRWKTNLSPTRFYRKVAHWLIIKNEITGKHFSPRANLESPRLLIFRLKIKPSIRSAKRHPPLVSRSRLVNQFLWIEFRRCSLPLARIVRIKSALGKRGDSVHKIGAPV
jgi:hypothetical protein